MNSKILKIKNQSNIITASKNSIKKTIRLGNFRFLVTCKIQNISEFDIVVLQVIQSIWIEMKKGQNFSIDYIYKVMIGNNTARLSKEAKKATTITRDDIKKSLIILSKFIVHEIRFNDDLIKSISNVPLIDINVENNKFRINSEPVFLKLSRKYSDVFSISVISTNILRIKPLRRKYLHINKTNISFVYWFIWRVVEAKESSVIYYDELNTKIGLDTTVEKNKKDLRDGKISFELYKKRLKREEGYIKYNLVIPILKNVYHSGLISKYYFKKNKLLIEKEEKTWKNLECTREKK